MPSESSPLSPQYSTRKICTSLHGSELNGKRIHRSILDVQFFSNLSGLFLFKADQAISSNFYFNRGEFEHETICVETNVTAKGFHKTTCGMPRYRNEWMKSKT